MEQKTGDINSRSEFLTQLSRIDQRLNEKKSDKINLKEINCDPTHSDMENVNDKFPELILEETYDESGDLEIKRNSELRKQLLSVESHRNATKYNPVQTFKADKTEVANREYGIITEVPNDVSQKLKRRDLNRIIEKNEPQTFEKSKAKLAVPSYTSKACPRTVYRRMRPSSVPSRMGTSVSRAASGRPHSSPEHYSNRRLWSKARANQAVQQRLRRLSTVRWTAWQERMQDYANDEDEEEEEPKEKPIEIWKRKIRIVRMLCGVCLTLRKYAMEAGLMSSLVVPVSKRRAFGVRGDIIDFNLDDYRVQKEIPVPLSTIDLMEKPPEDRTEDEVHLIARCMRNLPSFRKYTTEMQLMMSKIVRYMRCGKRRVVLRKGHQGYSVYFIFTGSVSVVMDSENDSVFVKPEVVILRRGACFGEIALLQNTNRNATIVTAEECEFLVVDKEDFVANGVHLRMNDEFKFRLDFFSNWPSLHTWPPEHVRTLAYCSRSEDFGHNKVVIKDSRKNEWLWFIVKGTCEVLKLVNLHSSPSHLKTIKNLPCGFERFVASNNIETDDIDNNNCRPRAKTASLSRKRWKEPLQDQQRPQLSNHSSSEMTNIEDSMENHSDEGSGPPKIRLNLPVNESGDQRGEQSDPNAGIYVKVDRIRDGMCFGLDTLFGNDENERHRQEQFSLISKGCTLIHVPKTRFLELADSASLDKIRFEVREYPSEQELMHKFVANSVWDTYKQGLVEQVILKRHNPSALRGESLQKYMESKDGQAEGHVAYGAGILSSRDQAPQRRLNNRLKSARETTERSAQQLMAGDSHSSFQDTNNNSSSQLTSTSEAELIMDRQTQQRHYRPLTVPAKSLAKRERLRMVLQARAQEKDKWSRSARSGGGGGRESAMLDSGGRSGCNSVRRAQSVAVHKQQQQQQQHPSQQISLKYEINHMGTHSSRSSSHRDGDSDRSSTRLPRTGFKSSSFAAPRPTTVQLTSNTASAVSFMSCSEVLEDSGRSRTDPSRFKSSSVGFGEPEPGTRAKSAHVKRNYSIHKGERARPEHKTFKSKSTLFS